MKHLYTFLIACFLMVNSLSAGEATARAIRAYAVKLNDEKKISLVSTQEGKNLLSLHFEAYKLADVPQARQMIVDVVDGLSGEGWECEAEIVK